MARAIALIARAALGLTEAPVHERHSERLMSTTERYHAPRDIRLTWHARRRLALRPMVTTERAVPGVLAKLPRALVSVLADL
jgi:hypothetical protein